MSERHPLSEVHIDLRDCTEIELFALQCLHQERIRRSTEALEDIQIEVDKRKVIPLPRAT